MKKRSSMGRRSLLDIEVDLVKELRVHDIKGLERLASSVRDAQVNGIRMAAEVASDYDKYSSHPYLVSECILGKLNVMPGKPSKNPAAAKLDQVLSRLERKIDNLEGTMRFMAQAARRKLAQKAD